MTRCPKCNYFKVAIERRPDGNSKCIACRYEAPTKEFEVKNWDWIDQETQTQLDKLKSLMSVQLDMLEQNKQMSAEIEQLKAKNEKLRTKLADWQNGAELNELYIRQYDEITALKSKLKVAEDALGFYASDSSWNAVGAFFYNRVDSIDESTIEGLDRNTYFGGKTARQALKEMGEL